MRNVNGRLARLESRLEPPPKIVVVWDDSEIDRDDPNVIVIEWPEDSDYEQRKRPIGQT